MIKPGLGRGLGQLLKEAKVDSSLATPTEERDVVALTTGMKTLIRGNCADQSEKEKKIDSTCSLGFSLLAGDIALCLTAWRLMKLQNGGTDLAIALGSVIVAGWLGWLGMKCILDSKVERDEGGGR